MLGIMTSSEAGPKIAILGAGHVGPVVARLAAAAGYDVSVAASGDPEKIALTTQVLAPGAEARRAADALADADIVVLALPLHRSAELEPGPFSGKVVVDMMNYWPEVNGYLEAFDGSLLASSEIIARRFPDSQVVKTLNHLGYHQLDEEARPVGDPDRKALGVAGDDPTAVDQVSEFVDRIGFDPVPIDSLAASRVLEPDGLVFGRALPKPDFESAIGAVAG
jgi:8-hydroxy-5-deazaflavin:NADPH oxidoreductase